MTRQPHRSPSHTAEQNYVEVVRAVTSRLRAASTPDGTPDATTLPAAIEAACSRDWHADQHIRVPGPTWKAAVAAHLINDPTVTPTELIAWATAQFPCNPAGPRPALTRFLATLCAALTPAPARNPATAQPTLFSTNSR